MKKLKATLSKLPYGRSVVYGGQSHGARFSEFSQPELSSLICRCANREKRFEERLEEFEVEGVGAVGFGVGRIVMDFDEESIDAGGDGGAGEQRDELGLAAADSVGGGRLLHGVRGVKDDGRELAHDGERAEVDDEVVVAEGRAALGEEDTLVAGGADFFDAVSHVGRGNELALFDVDGAAGAAGGEQQVSLAAEEGGNLEHVDGLGGDFAVRWFVHVGEDWQARVARDATQDAHAFEESGTAIAFDAGAVGLVVAGFEDEGDVEIGRDALNGFGHGEGVRFRLDDAGAGDEKELPRAHLHGPNFERGVHEGDFTVDSDQWSEADHR